MRKAVKLQLIQLVDTVLEAHIEVKKKLNAKEYNSVRSILADCQDCAVMVGNTIEQFDNSQAEIISKLERIKYIETNSKTNIVTPTVKGEAIYDVVLKSMPDMLNPKLTASWEKGLEMVAKSEITSNEFMIKLEKYIKSKFDKLVV